MMSRLPVVIAPPKTCRRSGTSGVFPFGFGWQAVRTVAVVRCRSTNLSVQPRDIRARIIPSHAHHRIAVGLIESRTFPIQFRLLVPFETVLTASVAGWIAGFADKRRVFGARDNIFAQSE